MTEFPDKLKPLLREVLDVSEMHLDRVRGEFGADPSDEEYLDNIGELRAWLDGAPDFQLDFEIEGSDFDPALYAHLADETKNLYTQKHYPGQDILQVGRDMAFHITMRCGYRRLMPRAEPVPELPPCPRCAIAS